MAQVSAWRESPRIGEWTFPAIMSLVIALIIVSGFGPSYAAGLAPPGLPFWVHLHGAAMTAWVVLFAIQAALVRRGSRRTHRRLGLASIGLVVLIIPLGVATNLLAIRRGATPPFFTPAGMLAADFCDLLLFAGLYVWALRLRRRPDWHKRLLLCASVLLTWPAWGRLGPLHQFGLEMIIPLSVSCLILLALAGPVHDLVMHRSVHPAYLWGVGLIIAVQPLHVLVADTPAAKALAASMLPAGETKTP